MSDDEQDEPHQALPPQPDPAHPRPPSTVRIAVILCALLEDHLAKGSLQNLHMRFNLFDQHLVETNPVSEWSPLACFNGAFEEESPSDENINDVNDGGDEEVVCKPVAKYWKMVVEQAVDVKLAQYINANPELVVGIASPEEPFVGFRPIEISPLLDNDRCCSYSSGKPTGIEATVNDGVEMDMKQSFTNVKDDLFCGFHASVHVEKDLLDEQLLKELQPFSIIVKTARCLPGTIFEDPESEMNAELVNDRGEVDRFQLCKRYCDPIYASYELFEGFPMQRKVITDAVPQGNAKIKLDHKVTVLLGDVDPIHVAEYFQTNALRVELHDRDVDISIKPKDIFSSLNDDNQDVSLNGEDTKWKELRNRWRRYLSYRQKDESSEEVVDSTPNGENEQKELSSFEVDKIAWRELFEDRCSQMKKQCHGEAVFPLSELCASYTDITRKLVSSRGEHVAPFSSQNKAIDIKCVSNVVPANRRISSNGRIEQAEMDLSEEERHVRQPGRYLRANTELKLELSLTYPLLPHPDGLESHEQPTIDSDQPSPMMFQRHVYVFAYENAKLLQRIRAAVDEINGKAISGAVLRTHQFSETEQAAAEDGNLDIVTGFQCVDDEFRIVVLEGLASGSMALLTERLGRERANNDQYKVLSNSQKSYTRRLYTAFSVDLKVIRLREPLGIVVRFPEIYDHTRVSDACYGALQFLCEMRNATRIEYLKRESFFPTVDMLQVLESKYGESVSILDMTGVPAKPLKRRSKNREALEKSVDSQCLGLSSNQQDHEKDKEVAVKPRRKPATDSYNPGYLEWRRSYKAKNFLVENERGRAEALAAGKQRLEAREMVAKQLLDDYQRSSGQKEVFMCSGQKLNFIEWQKGRLRDKLSKNKGATFTYSKRFQSLSFCLVDEERVAQEDKEKSQQRFTTPSGFIYPAPRTSKESREHPRKLSQARIEELQQPYDFSRLDNRGALEEMQDLEDFDCVPTKEYEVFGGYNRDGTRNPAFFKSVHLVGKEVHEEMEERKRKEAEDWRRKVVVDNLRFLPYSGTKAQKPSQLDKLKGILRGRPNKRGLKVVARAKLPSGKRIPLKPPPVSIFNHEDGSKN